MKKNFFSIKNPKWGLLALFMTFCCLFAESAMAQYNNNYAWGGGVSNSWTGSGNWSRTGKFVHTANYASGSTTVTIATANLLTTTTILAVGHAISGPGIPYGTTVTAFSAVPATGTTITLSQATTAAGTGAVIFTYLKHTGSDALPHTAYGTDASNAGTATVILDFGSNPVVKAGTFAAGSIVLMRNNFASGPISTITIEDGGTLNVRNVNGSVPMQLAGGNIVNNGTLNITHAVVGAPVGIACNIPTVPPGAPTEFGYSGNGILKIDVSTATTGGSAAVNVTSLNAFATYRMNFNEANTTILLGSAATSFAFRSAGGAGISPLIIGGTGVTLGKTSPATGGLLSIGSQSTVTVEATAVLTMNSLGANLSNGITMGNNNVAVATNFTNKGTINMLGSSSRSGLTFSITSATSSPIQQTINFTNEGTINVDMNISVVPQSALAVTNAFGGFPNALTSLNINNTSTGVMTLKNTASTPGTGFSIFVDTAGQINSTLITNNGILNLDSTTHAFASKVSIINNGTINTNNELRSFTAITNNATGSINFNKNARTAINRLVTFGGLTSGTVGLISTDFARAGVGSIYQDTAGNQFTVLVQKFNSFGNTLITSVVSTTNMSTIPTSGTLTRIVGTDAASNVLIPYTDIAASPVAFPAGAVDAAAGVSFPSLNSALRSNTTNSGTINTGTGSDLNNISSATHTATAVIAPGGTGYGVADLGVVGALPLQGTLKLQVDGTTIGTNCDQLTNSFGGSGYTSAPTISFVGGGGSGATATVTLVATSVASIVLTNKGAGYTVAPTVTIAAPASGVTATATATILNGEISAINITNGGSGYTTAPTVSIAATTPAATTAATAVSSLTGTSISSITLTAGGTNYINTPTITFSTTSGTSAVATATVSGGVVTAVALNSGGSGYNRIPTVTFSSGAIGATATATVSGGVVTGYTITNGGSGFSSSPSVVVSGGGGSGASATATISGGAITGINTALSLSSLNLDLTSLYIPEVDVTIPIVTTSGAGTITGNFAGVTGLKPGWAINNNVATNRVELVYDWQIPTALSVCSNTTIGTIVGNSTMKFYKKSTDTVTVPTSTALKANTTYFVSETPVGGPESAKVVVNVTVNALPLAPAAVVSNPLGESKLICKYIGSSIPVTFDATSVATATSYNWDVPAGASIVSGSTTNSIGVSFASASTTAGAIGSVTVRAVDANGCISLPKALALSTKAPTAPTALVMTSTNSTPHFEVKDPLTSVVSVVGLNTLTKITKVGPYMGTNTVFTLTAPVAETAASYKWTLPTGVNAIASSTVTNVGSGISTSTTPVITVNFAGVPAGIGSLPIVVQSVGGCGSSSNRTLSLARAVPGAPKALVLTSSNTTPRFSGTTGLVGLNTLAKITKVGPYQSTTLDFTLTATPFMVQGATATSYAWILPAGVVCTSSNTATTVYQNINTGTTEAPVIVSTPFAAIKTTTNTINILFNTTGIGNLDLLVFGVNGAGNSVARKLVVTRSLPTAPTKLVLTDDALSTTAPVTKVGAYTGKTTVLTLTGTPFTTQGAEGRKFYWKLPAGVNVLSGVIPTELTTPPVTDVNGFKTWTSAFSTTSSGMVLTVNLAGIIPGVTSIPLSVQSQNEAGTSATSRVLTLTAAAPTPPAIVGSTGTTYTSCANTTYTATAFQGATYNWGIPAGASIVGPSTGNVIVVNYSGVTVAVGQSAAVTCIATNGTGSSPTKSLTVKRLLGSCKSAGTAVASEFSVNAYPNPSSSEFTIDATGKGATSAKVYDMQGRLIENSKSNSNSVRVGSKLAAGTYNVIVTQGANAKSVRVIKK